MIRRVFQDKLFLLMMGFAAMVFMMLPHLNPPADESTVQPPGNVIVNIVWPKGDYDVDLWLYGPGESRPVGYTNKNGRLWNLLRDDLGVHNDPTGINYENGYTRGILPGEYIVNVHCYKCPRLPLPVNVVVSVKPVTEGNPAIKVIATTVATILSPKEEITALRFQLTKKGTLVPGTLNHRFVPLRAATSRPGEGMVQ